VTADITIAGVQCSRCGHKWVPKGLTRPKRCANPKCRSPYWDIEKRVTTKGKDHAKD
jgi:predicted Zn-ribbon and HTH transcriptional regulator